MQLIADGVVDNSDPTMAIWQTLVAPVNVSQQGTKLGRAFQPVDRFKSTCSSTIAC